MARLKPDGSNARRRQALIEWGFIAFLLALCGGLTALQYYWTGEVARAEVRQLDANLSDQVQIFCQRFDAELVDACEQLLPTARDIEQLGRETAHTQRLRTWKSNRPHPIFSRIAFAAVTNGTLQLYELDQKEIAVAPIPWPMEWSTLKDHVTRRQRGPGGPGGPGGRGRPDDGRGPRGERGGPPPPGDRGPGGPRGGFGPGAPPDGAPSNFFDSSGVLAEFPIFGSSIPRNGARETEWVIFELNIAYATNNWLPRLIKNYLNPGSRNLNQIKIKQAGSSQTTLLSNGPNFLSEDGKTITQTFNPQLGLFGPRDGSKGDGRWMIEAQHKPDAIDQVVASSRRRNLGLAILLNVMVLAAGIALVHYTGRSRQLATNQMNFVASVSHELLTPLTVIKGAGQNLYRGIAREPDQIRDYSQMIIQHADQLHEMVEQVLAMATAKTQGKASWRPVSLVETIEAAASAVAADIEAAGCDLQMELPDDLPLVEGDASALRRVFQNLLSNAARHGGAGKWIGVSAQEIGAMVVIGVTDRGVGIPEAEQTGIFKAFVRGSVADQQAVRGTGLGLSIVREIVESHGGTVSVNSQAEHGATFVVQLPAAGRVT